MNFPAKNENTHVATLSGESIDCHAGNYEQACRYLMEQHPGAGVPEVKPLPAKTITQAVQQRETGAPQSIVVPMRVLDSAVEEVSQAGRFRAMQDEALARANGFAPQQPIYSIGTRVNELGVENARCSQIEHEAKPPARELAKSLAEKVRAEERRDYDPVTLYQTRMNGAGELVLGDERYPISETAFEKFAGRAIPASHAGPYLSSCPAPIRGANWNVWADRQRDDEKTHVMRTRLEGGRRTVFAVVSEKYAAFDADKVGDALARAFPHDARGTLDYDGTRYRVEGLWHSDVAPGEFVAGEIFKAGVIVRGADDGGRSIRVQSVIWRNLCRNLIILDKSVGVDIRLRHSGSTHRLAHSFSTAFNQALTSVAGFRKAWGAAMGERDGYLVQRSAGTTSDDIMGLPVSAVLPGLFNGILERDLVPVRGRRGDVVQKLVHMHQQDEAAAAYGVSRASIVNAFTRYAHAYEQDTFQADEIREGAGALLSSGKRGAAPAPLPYLAIPL